MRGGWPGALLAVGSPGRRSFRGPGWCPAGRQWLDAVVVSAVGVCSLAAGVFLLVVLSRRSATDAPMRCPSPEGHLATRKLSTAARPWPFAGCLVNPPPVGVWLAWSGICAHC